MATRPTSPSLETILQNVLRRLGKLETSDRIGYAAIPHGGKLVVVDATGTAVLRIGTLNNGTDHGIERWTGSAWVTVTNATEDKVQSGSTAFAMSGTNNDTGSVSFPRSFSTAPKVTCTATIAGGANIDVLVVVTSGPTSSGFSWRARDRAGDLVTVSGTIQWIAVLP